MPAHWLIELKAPASPGAFASDGPVACLEVRPHQSLTPEGFVGFMGVTLALISLPLLFVVGSPVLWGLLPFFGIVVWGLWYAIGRNRRDTMLLETLTFWSNRVELVRRGPRGSEQRWEANPHWVKVEMHREKGPVENYITLSGNDRTVEIGAFLSPEERKTLFDQLTRVFERLRSIQ